MELFAEYGVSGTSLQMIADRLGVTKAAVYHQFPTKDEIVLAVIEPVLAPLEALAEATARRLATLEAVIALVVAQRRPAAVLTYDPVVIRLVRGHPAVPTLERILALPSPS